MLGITDGSFIIVKTTELRGSYKYQKCDAGTNHATDIKGRRLRVK